MAVTTLREAYRLGWKAKAHCIWRGPHYKPGHRNTVVMCDTARDLDMMTLIWTRGEAFPLEGLPSWLKCPSCGRRGVRVLWTIPNQPKAATQRG